MAVPVAQDSFFPLFSFLSVFQKRKCPQGTYSQSCSAERSPLPSLVSHSPASLPPVSRGPAPCPCIPWEPTWDSGLPGPLCTPSSERQSCSRQEGVSGWTRPARPRTPTSLPTPRDESLLGAARPACIAGLKTQFPQNEASLLCFMPGP